MDSIYSTQARQEEARALRAEFGSFVDHHEQQLFDAQQRLRHPTDATHWSRHSDVVTVQLADTPHHTSFGAYHQPLQRRAYQLSSIADLFGSEMAMANPRLFRSVVAFASLNVEMRALCDEALRCHVPPLVLVGDENENCYKHESTTMQRNFGSSGDRGDAQRGVRQATNARTGQCFPSSQHPLHLKEQEDMVGEEKLLRSTGPLLGRLQDLWLWRQRVQDVVAHALFQISILYTDARSKKSKSDLPALLNVRLLSFWDSLANLLGAVLLVGEVLHQNSSIRNGLELMQRLLGQQLRDTEDDDKVMQLLLQKLQTDLLDCDLLASVAARDFDQVFQASLALCEQDELIPAAAASSTQHGAISAQQSQPFREHVALCKELIAVVTDRCNDLDANLASSLSAGKYTSSLTALCGMCYLMQGLFLRPPPPRGSSATGPPSVAATTVSNLVTETLKGVGKKITSWQSVAPLLPLQGLTVLCPLLWWRHAFPAELATPSGGFKVGVGALVRQTVVEACQISSSQFLASISQWTQQVERWANVDMQSSQPIDAPLCRTFVQKTVFLVQQGVALSRNVQAEASQLLLLHHHAELALTVPMVHGVLSSVLLLQRIAHCFHSKMGILASAQAALVQSIVYVLEKHLYNLLIRTKNTRPNAAAVLTAVLQEQLLVLQGALHILHKPLTTDTLVCLNLLVDIALNRDMVQQGNTSPAISEHERDDILIALAQLEAVITYQQTLSSTTSTAFLFFYREALYPLFFKYCYDHTLAAASLPELVSALHDCLPLIMSARHVKNRSETLLSEYVEFVRDCIQHELVHPLCIEIENQLRVHTHNAVLGQPYRVLRPFTEAPGRDLTRYTLLRPFQFFNEWMHLTVHIEHYLSTQFYNLNALMPNDWKTYEEMRSLALHTYHLRVADSHLPSCIQDQGLDVLVITENIHQFVVYYTYNLNEQLFVQHPSLTPSKHLHTLNTRHIANSIRTHGTGVMNTAVNYVYKSLLKKLAVLSHFIHDDYVRSHLLKDVRAVRQRKREQQPIKYPVEQADQFIHEMNRLGVAQDGVPFLEKARQLISEMGNALGFMRMMRSGGLRAVAESARFVPLPTSAARVGSATEGSAAAKGLSSASVMRKRGTSLTPRKSPDNTGDEGQEEEASEDGTGDGGNENDQQKHQPTLRRSAVDAVANLGGVVDSMLEQLSDGSQYFPLLLNAIGHRLRRASAERYSHLQLLYLLIPALANLQVAYTIREKEKLLKKHKEEGIFTDDGFAVGATFLLLLFRAHDPFDALHWFENKKAQYRGKLEAVQAALATPTAGGSTELDNLHFTSSTLHAHLKEYTGLENAFTSSRRLFDIAASPSSSASAGARSAPSDEDNEEELGR